MSDAHIDRLLDAALHTGDLTAAKSKTAEPKDTRDIETMIDLGRPVRLGGHPEIGVHSTAYESYGTRLEQLTVKAKPEEAPKLLEIWLARFTSGFKDEGDPYFELLQLAEKLVPLAYQNTEQGENGARSTARVHNKIQTLVENYIGPEGSRVNGALGDFSDRFVGLIDKYSRQPPLFPVYKYIDNGIRFDDSIFDKIPTTAAAAPEAKFVATIRNGAATVVEAPVLADAGKTLTRRKPRKPSREGSTAEPSQIGPIRDDDRAVEIFKTQLENLGKS